MWLLKYKMMLGTDNRYVNFNLARSSIYILNGRPEKTNHFHFSFIWLQSKDKQFCKNWDVAWSNSLAKQVLILNWNYILSQSGVTFNSHFVAVFFYMVLTS